MSDTDSNTSGIAIGEKVLWRGHPSYWQLIGFYAQIVLLVVVVGAITYFLNTEGVIGTFLTVIIYLVAVGVGGVVIYTRRALIVYTVTSQRVRVERGLFVRHRDECSVKRVQNAQTSISLLQRMVGIGTVDIDTAGDESINHMVLSGVRNPYAVASYITSHSLGPNDEDSGI